MHNARFRIAVQSGKALYFMGSRLSRYGGEQMSSFQHKSSTILVAAIAAGVFAFAGNAMAEMVNLSGDAEVPPVKSSGSASGEVNVKPDGSVSGSIKVTGFMPTAAHIHQGAAGANGPVIVPMTKEGADTFVFPANAKMTPEQMQACKAGNTYVNVHSDANKGGEVRAQLKCS
jgi:hypothetical protein